MRFLLLAILALQDPEPSKNAEQAYEALDQILAGSDPAALKRRVSADRSWVLRYSEDRILKAILRTSAEGKADFKPLRALADACESLEGLDARTRKQHATIRLRVEMAAKMDVATATVFFTAVEKFSAAIDKVATDVLAAQKDFEELAEQFQAFGDPTLRLASLSFSGQLLLSTGDFKRAAAAFDQARTFVGTTGILEAEAATTGNYAFCILNLGRLEEALKLLESVRPLARETGNKDLEGTFAGNTGLCLQYMGRVREAAVLYDEALRLLDEAGNTVGVATQHGNIAFAQQSIGRYRDALIHYEKSLEMNRALENKAGEAITLGNLGVLHYSCGRHALAADHINRALALYRGEKNKAGEALMLGCLGSLCVSEGRIEQALKHFESMRDLSDKIGNRNAVALALLNLAFADAALKHHDQAVKHAEEARKELGAIGNRLGESYALLALAQARTATEKPAEARAAIEEALRIAQEVESRELEAACLTMLGDLDLEVGRIEDAVRNLEDAQRAFETVRASFGMLTAEKLAWFGERRGAYESAVTAYVRAKRPRDAFFLMEQMRSRALQDALGRSRNGADAPPELLDARSKLGLEYSARHKELNEGLAAGAPKERLDALRTELRRVEEQLRETSRKIEMSQNLEEARPLSAGEVQRVLKDGEAVVLFNVVGQGDRILCALVFRRDVKVLELKKTEGFDAQLRWIREAAAATRQGFPAAQYQKRAKAIYTALFSPLEKDLKDIKTLIICPDEGLYGVPFEALTSGGGTDYASLDYLGKRFTVRIAYCATLLARRRAAFDAPQGKGMIVFGDPEYPSRQPAADRGEAPTELPDDLKEFSKPVEGVRAGWARLPHSGAEAKEIAALFKTEPLLGPGASEGAARKLEGARYLHFACHGYVDAEDPMRSALILTADGGHDGYLEAREIADLKLPAELVVLSACDTARGEVLRGEGLIGLTRALMIAGARSVIASLWTVADEAGKEFMVRFYRKLADGKEKSAALSETKREFMAHERYSAPYYWAGFVLHGE